MNKILLFIVFLISGHLAQAQHGYWQQRVSYQMDIKMDVSKHQFNGQQRLAYFNNSPDTLTKVFYHLYFNAFQPGSVMDIRNQNLPDSDDRVDGRIAKLTASEQGFLHVQSLVMDGSEVKFKENGTILEVQLDQPIFPGHSATFQMAFTGQVPLQIRRSGRESSEGVMYSMSQWYPKMCEYDYQGWHANPYIGREFHGVWGDFDVKINIDKDYTIGGTGYLQNVQEIGKGYEDDKMRVEKSSSPTLTWHFYAPNVHDFVWAGDPDYTHKKFVRKDGMTMHFLYQPGEKTTENWEKLPNIMDKAFEYINQRWGQYPYKQYSFIQGGDGGMEYPMATLISGERSLGSLTGVSVHELLHAWFQGMLATNESLYHWMDEGFTSYATAETMNYLVGLNLFPGKVNEFPHTNAYRGYARLVESGTEEPMSTHADAYKSNFAYGIDAYSKGEIYLNQLSYVIGQEAFDKGMLNYFHTWKFKHPNPNDHTRIMEKASGLELDWYREYMINSTRSIDYAVSDVQKDGNRDSKIILTNAGFFPMPIDVVVTYENGDKSYHTIPLDIMRGAKPAEKGMDWKVEADWNWVNPTYELNVDSKLKKIKEVVIDPSMRMADLNRGNNIWPMVVKEDEMKKD